MGSYVKEQKTKFPKKSEQSIRNKFYAKDNMRDELEREILNFLENYHEDFEEKLVLWDGFCRVCLNKKDEGCTRVSGKPCRYPDKKRYSMEAIGIHVTQTVKNLNLGIEWPPINYYYRFGLVCFK